MPMKIIENKGEHSIINLLSHLKKEYTGSAIVKIDENTGNINVFNGGKAVVSFQNSKTPSTIHVFADTGTLLDDIVTSIEKLN